MIALAFLLLLAAERPLSLPEAWSLAAAHDLSLAAARADAGQAHAVVNQGYALLLPTVDAHASMQWNDSQLPLTLAGQTFFLQPWWVFNWELVANQNLSFHGPAIPLLKQAIDSAHASDAATVQRRIEVEFAVARAYYGALTASSLEQLAQQAQATAREELRVSEGRASGGRATRADILRAQVRLAEADMHLADARRARESANDLLGDAVGLPGPFALLRPPRPEAPQEASGIERRPDVSAAGDLRAGAEQGRIAAQRQFLPTLAFQAAYSGYDVAGGQLFGVPPTRTTLIGIASMPLFDGTLRYWQLREKQEALQSARAREEATLLAARADLRRARQALAADREAEELARKRLELASTARELVLSQYQLGAATGLELADADNAKAAAARDAVQAELDADLAVLDLDRALGLSPAEATR